MLCLLRKPDWNGSVCYCSEDDPGADIFLSFCMFIVDTSSENYSQESIMGFSFVHLKVIHTTDSGVKVKQTTFFSSNAE